MRSSDGTRSSARISTSSPRPSASRCAATVRPMEIRAVRPDEQAALGELTVAAYAEHWRQTLLHRGSTTERVLRGAPCPVLMVPAA